SSPCGRACCRFRDGGRRSCLEYSVKFQIIGALQPEKGLGFTEALDRAKRFPRRGGRLTSAGGVASDTSAAGGSPRIPGPATRAETAGRRRARPFQRAG